MKVSQIPPASVSEAWPWLGPLLEPAVNYQNEIDINELKQGLIDGTYEVVEVETGGSFGVVVTHLYEKDGLRKLCISFIAGQHNGGPKRLRQILVTLMDFYKNAAADHGCDVIRIGGRNYDWLFPEFERVDGPDNPREMRLSNGKR